jgi:glycosyltransferase involved in cell wall biosynthesis
MTQPQIAVLVHGGPDSIEAARARGLTQRYPADRVRLLFREGTRLATAKRWSREVRALCPAVVYVINTALPGALLACWWWRRRRIPFVLDTGDVVYEMARCSGVPQAWKLPALKIVEGLAQRTANTIVTRGGKHVEHLRVRGYRRVVLIRDGYVDRGKIPDCDIVKRRNELGLGNKFVVGVLGSLVYSPRLKICYGWDLVDALAELADLPIHGLIIGDGNGRRWLEERAGARGVGGRITFCGRIPYEQVPVHLHLMDAAISTQTNNLPGQVRTTGKLAEYMAAGRFILASRVGDAALLLPEAMLVDFNGEVDAAYPKKLAARLRAIWADRRILDARDRLPEIAQRNCSYEVLSTRFNTVIMEAVSDLR